SAGDKPKLTTAILKKLGIEIVRGESFWIEPKLEVKTA
ncbi:MAG: hypothetical protein JWM68_2505, partial [Verrucomicrobiales bacterium]|nr:hypothetical protein [Verrucomicrobiales bacterium]